MNKRPLRPHEHRRGRSPDLRFHTSGAPSVAKAPQTSCSLSAPLITLSVSPARREEAEQAFTMLCDAGVGFRVIAGMNDVTTAEYAGTPYAGLHSIASLVDALRSYREVLRQGVDAHFGSLRDSRVQAIAEGELTLQRDVARQAFTAIFAAEKAA